MRNNTTKKLTLSGICLALSVLLPLFIVQIPQIGVALSPMHIPILLCAFLAGPFYAAAIGVIAPLLNFLLRGVPPIIPMGLTMVFELAAYGLIAGMLYLKLPDKTISIYVSLIVSMFFGRIVWGFAAAVVFNFAGIPFSMQAFVAAAFINAIPAIILHIVLIPIVVLALKRAGLAEGR